MIERKFTALRGLIQVKHGFPFKGEHFESSGRYVVLTPGNFYERGGFKRNAEKDKCYSESFPNEYLLKKGDFLVAMTEQTDGLLGSMAIIPDNDRFLHNQRLGLVRALTNDVDVEFLYHLFKTKSVREQIRRSASGSKVKHTSPERIYDVQVQLPSSREQVAIARLLSTLDAKIETNNRINDELERTAKLLYDYWFVQFDFPITAAQAAAMGKPRLEGNPYQSSGGPMVYRPELKREIPASWTVKPLFDAMDIQYGFPFSKKQFTTEITAVPVVRIRDILDNSISLYTTQQVDAKYRLKCNDLVVGMDGIFHVNFWDKEGSYLNQRSVRMRAKENSPISSFQAYFELSPYMRAREKNISRTTVGHLSDKDLKRLHLLSPETSREFDPRTTFDLHLSTITHNRVQNQELATIRDWLLPMLMNGQVTVG